MWAWKTTGKCETSSSSTGIGIQPVGVDKIRSPFLDPLKGRLRSKLFAAPPRHVEPGRIDRRAQRILWTFVEQSDVVTTLG